jgi:hypothetical protein
MKANRILLLCSALALPQLAMADLADTNPQGLGDIQALLKFCAQVDPRNAAAFQQQWASIVGNSTGKQLDVAEDNSGFKQGSNATSEVLHKLSRSTAAGICADTAARWDGKVATAPAKGPDDQSRGNDRDAMRPDPSRNDRH